MNSLRKRLQSNGMDLSITDAALDELGLAGFDPVYGARPLKRAIQQYVENPLAQQILAGKLMTGYRIIVDWQDEKMVFSQEKLS